jgi:hypothetical protein
MMFGKFSRQANSSQCHTPPGGLGSLQEALLLQLQHKPIVISTFFSGGVAPPAGIRSADSDTSSKSSQNITGCLSPMRYPQATVLLQVWQMPAGGSFFIIEKAPLSLFVERKSLSTGYPVKDRKSQYLCHQ